MKKTELWVAVAGIIASMCTALLSSGLIAESSVAAAIIGMVVTACTYIAGRSWAKGKASEAEAAVANSAAAHSIRTTPPPLPQLDTSSPS